MADEKHLSVADMSEPPTIAPSAVSLEEKTTADADADAASIGNSSNSSNTSRSVAGGQTDRIRRSQQTTEPLATAQEAREKHSHLDELSHAATATSQKSRGHSVSQIQTREDGTEYPTGVKLGLIVLALCLSVFLMALDNSIIATAIPKITDQFHSVPDIGWYGSAYLLTTASLQLLFGKFYSFLSIKWVFLVAISIFELGSLICGVANSSTTLIVGRAVAGVGSAGIFSGALIILAYSVPLSRRPMMSGFIGSMYGVASVSGPLLGGLFTDEVTWRWCFFINLPIGAITVAVIAIFFPDPTRQLSQETETWASRIRKMDPIGTAIFMPAVICLLLALQWGGTTYPWSDGRIVALFVLFGVLILAFLYVQHRQGEMATVPPRIFFKRSVWSSGLYSFSIGAAFLCTIYFLPIWFQAVKNASAVRSGIMNLPMLVAVVLCSVFAGIVVTVFGYYSPFMIVGTVLTSAGYGLLTTFTPDTPSATWIGYQILAGAGVGLGMQQPLMAVQTVLNIADVPTGTAVVVFLQTLGGALFVSVGENVFSNRLTQNLLANVPEVDPIEVLSIGATQLQQIIHAEFLPAVILAYSDALTKAFTVSAAMACFSVIGAIFVEWKSVKGMNIQAGAAA